MFKDWLTKEAETSARITTLYQRFAAQLRRDGDIPRSAYYAELADAYKRQAAHLRKLRELPLLLRLGGIALYLTSPHLAGET